MTDQVHESTGKRRRSLLNKFLTKTYYMLEQCPKDIASWSNDGHSFTIKDVDAFENEVLPKYFNHSKFPSFIRQLNFYGFSKQRSDPDLQTHTKAVRFSHQFFRKGYPELLHKIKRTTASKQQIDTPLPNGQVESLQQQVADLREQVAHLEDQMEDRIEDAIESLERAYLLRIRSLEKSLEALWAASLSPQYSGALATTPYMATSLSPHLQSLAQLSDYSELLQKTALDALGTKPTGMEILIPGLLRLVSLPRRKLPKVKRIGK